MSRTKKLKVGPMPQQEEDYSRYEETEILWGRIAMVILVLALLALGIATTLHKNAESGNGVKTGINVMPPLVKSESVQKPEALAESLQTAAPKMQSEATVAKSDSPSSPIETIPEPSTESLPVEVPPAPALTEVISPVSVYHEGLVRAELTHKLKKGQPDAILGYRIPMTDEGIIKVIFYTEMNALKGTVLFHDWYRKDKRMARVKIPVNVASQSSYSSKFINAQMLGDWTVKIVDAKGELYGEANFSVQ